MIQVLGARFIRELCDALARDSRSSRTENRPMYYGTQP